MYNGSVCIKFVGGIIMSKYSICVIGVYFGNLPKYFNLWLKSCKHNPSIDFLIITDNELHNLPANVHSVKMTLDEMKERAEKAVGFEVVLDRPYKCCDYKIIYGLIFKDYLEKYDFWGHCDFDLIFGDIRHFATDDVLEKNDKIFDLGHLSLYRNTEAVNNRYKCNGTICPDYKATFTNTFITAIDEHSGIYQIYKKNNFPMYDERVFADIYSVFSHFSAVGLSEGIKTQAFYWENGKVWLVYKDKNDIESKEVAYIHFQKRKFHSTLTDNVNSFYISSKGFTEKVTEGIPTVSEINAINPYHPVVHIIESFKRKLMFVKKRIYQKFLNKEKI